MRWGRRALLVMLGAVLALASATLAAPTPSHMHFTAVGDYGAGAAAARVLEEVALADPDAHFALGDLAYGDTPTEDAWCEFVVARVGEGFPFELIAGNHESNGQDGHINNFSACLPNQLPGAVGTYGRQYYVDVPKDDPLVRFVMISPDLQFPDGTWNYSAGGARYAWTAGVLDEARTQQIPWLVVGMHKPCLSVGQYACTIGADLGNLLLAKKVDLVLSGHEHNYQRTKQLALGPGCPTLDISGFDADCVTDGDDDLVAKNGTVFMIIGTGGRSQRQINQTDPDAGYFAALSGSDLNETYGFSDFDVTPDVLTVSFARASGGTFSDTFTLTRDPNPPANQSPVAAFTADPSGASVDFDATGSSDPDGVVTAHQWDFGDGGTGAGAIVSHEYQASDTYDVTLTVTDDDGAVDTVTHPVTVTAPTTQVLASDQFERTETNAWGIADVGGPWTVSSVNGVSAVSGGLARTVMRSPGARPLSVLNDVSAADVEVSYELALDKLPTGNNARVDQSTVVRRNGSTEYRAVVRVQPTGAVRVKVIRVVNGAQSVIAGDAAVSGVSYAVGETLEVRVRVTTGATATEASVKVWEAGTPEPADWSITRQDSTAALQGPGSVGIAPYLASTATNAPVQASYDNFEVRQLP